MGSQAWYNLSMKTQQGDNQLTDKQLEQGYWLATHRELLRKIGIGILIAIASSMVILFLVQLIVWATHIKQTNQIWTDISLPIVDYKAVDRPIDIQVNTAIAVKHNDSSVDVVFGLKNMNRTFGAADIEYEVFVGGQSAGKEHVSLAPGQDKYLTKSSIPANGGTPPGVSVSIYDVQWTRLKRIDLLPDVAWEFSDANFSYIRATSDTAAFQSELELTIRNKSVYGFRAPQVVVLMKDENSVIQGIGTLQIDAISSLETRTIVFRWPERLPRTVQPTIFVNVDTLDPNMIISE